VKYDVDDSTANIVACLSNGLNILSFTFICMYNGDFQLNGHLPTGIEDN
jgi:hypothetical protein